MKIAIIGRGNVGRALAAGLERAGHEVRAVGRDAAAVREAGEFADLAILAIPYAGIDDAVGMLGGSLDGKILIDATNPLTPDFTNLVVGFEISGAETLQVRLPAVRVVKAFNTTFAATMETGHVQGRQISAFVAGDDNEARKAVIDLAAELGFDPIDVGVLANARLLEPFALLAIRLALVQGYGTELGFKLIH